MFNNNYEYERRLTKLEKMEDFLKYPSITPGFNTFESFIERKAGHILEQKSDTFTNGATIQEERLNALCDYLGVEIIESPKYTVRKISKGTTRSVGKPKRVSGKRNK